MNAIAGALTDVDAQSVQQVAAVFKALNYTTAQIADILQDGLGQAAAAAATVLKAIGAAANEIAGALQSVFGEAVSAVANLLSSIGFSNDTINAIGGAFESFGKAVENCFLSFFSDC